MDIIRQAATGICFISVIIGAVYLLSPAAAIGKNLKFVCGLLMTVCIISPFIAANIEGIEIMEEPQIELNAENMLTVQNEYIIKTALIKSGFSFRDIEIDAEYSDDSGISISNVYIYGAKDHDKIRNFIESAFSVQEVVFYE